MSKLYIGSELADFNEVFNVMFSIGDIRDLSAGSNNKTYTLNLPLTKTNKRLLKFISQPDVKSEPSAIGRLYIGEQLIIQGAIIILGYSDYFAKIIILQDDWMDSLANKKMTDLDLSAYNHALDHDIVANSWLDPYVFYRYPMIDFGGLASNLELAHPNYWRPNDFIPMVSISQLIAKILSPYTINSAWLGAAFIKDLYVLTRETIVPDTFIKDKGFDVNEGALVDNSSSVIVGAGLQGSAGYGNRVVVFNTVTTDEATAWNATTNKYTIPATGTYRFASTIKTYNNNHEISLLTTSNEALNIKLIKSTGGTETILDEYMAPAYVGTELLDDFTTTLDSGYYHFIAGDMIFVKASMTWFGHNTGAGNVTVIIGIAPIVSKIIAIWNNVNRYSGLMRNISLEEMLPDMLQLDFLTAIRSIFNLRFWLDKSKRVLYIEPWDSFISSTVVNITEFIDFSVEPDTELISSNYNKNITLKWKDDKNDQAYVEYLKSNTNGPGGCEITLASLFAKPSVDVREHSFSSLIIDDLTHLPRIWNVKPDPIVPQFDRKIDFITRLVHWDGLTSVFTWLFDTETKTQYPLISGLDFTTIYTTYWQKLFHYIDKGKLLTIRMKVKPMFLTEFFTVISNSNNEGFRPTYQINDDYYFLQTVTTDGISAELELILKT